MDLWDRMSQSGELIGTIGLTVLGIVMYIMLRFSYFVFYNKFGVSPEEVGLGYIEILVRSGPTLIVAVLISAAGSAFFSRLLRVSRPDLRRNALLGVIAILLIILFGGPVRANRLAEVVQGGTPIHPLTVGELLGIQVDYVSLERVSGDQAGDAPAGPVEPQRPVAGLEAAAKQAAPVGETPSDISQRTSLLYFGQSNGIAVLYDHARQQIIRIPMSEVTMVAG